MFRSFLILCCLVLLGGYSVEAFGQITRNQNQSSATLSSRQPSTQAKELLDEGLRLVDAGQLSQAAEAFQRAITLDPEYAEAYSSLGRTYFKLRQWQKALDNLHRAAAMIK